VDRFLKFFHYVIRKKILYVHMTKIFTSLAIYCYNTDVLSPCGMDWDSALWMTPLSSGDVVC